MAFPWEGKLYVVLTDRFKSIELTAFAFIHELIHILNRDIAIESTDVQFLGNGFDHENLATQAAVRWLLGVDQEALIQEVSEVDDKSKVLMEWSKRLGVPPGIIVTILQHLGTLDYSAQRQFLHPYHCTPDFQFWRF